MAQLLFVSCQFLLFHSTVERNRTGGFVAELQSLLNLAMDGAFSFDQEVVEVHFGVGFCICRIICYLYAPKPKP